MKSHEPEFGQEAKQDGLNVHELPAQEQSFLKRFARSRLGRAFLYVTTLLAAERAAHAQQPPQKPQAALMQKGPAKPEKKPLDPWTPNPKPTLNAFNDGGLRREMEVTEMLRLTNYRSVDDLVAAEKRGEIVSMEPDAGDWYEVDQTIAAGKVGESTRYLFRYNTPYTRNYLREKVKKYYDHFMRTTRRPPTKIKVTSAVRTEKYVDILRKKNDNVAPDYSSTHLKGTTFDFLWNSLTPAEQQWWEQELKNDEGLGIVEATKERGQPVYHVMVIPPHDTEPKPGEEPEDDDDGPLAVREQMP